MTPAQARDLALEVGLAAGERIAAAWRGGSFTVATKSGATDLVTEWDGRIEAEVSGELVRRAPGTRALGEELGGDDRGATWVIDPIDGTVNFVHGHPFFCVSIGYQEDGEPLAGVVVAPVLGWVFVGARGHGARKRVAGTWTPMCVSATARLDQALLATGFPYDRRTSPKNNFAPFVHMQRQAGAVRRMGSAALDLCMLAAGWFDGYWELKVKPWDIAAGRVLVTEAGGRVSGWDGGPMIAGDSIDLVASNGSIHDELVRGLAAVP